MISMLLGLLLRRRQRRAFQTGAYLAFRAECAAPRCGRFSWARTQELFDQHTARSGGSQVKRTLAGPWACREHAYMVGGGWA